MESYLDKPASTASLQRRLVSTRRSPRKRCAIELMGCHNEYQPSIAPRRIFMAAIGCAFAAALFAYHPVAGAQQADGTAAHPIISGNTGEGTGYVLPYFLAERTAGREGFVRIVNRSAQAGAVTLTAIDDEGHTAGTETLNLAANGAIHFRSRDLERGNTAKGLSGVGTPGAGHWRLVLTSSLDIQPLAYVRTTDGFVTRIDAVEAEAEGSANRYVVHFFNPGRNQNQRSYLRLINPGSAGTRITIDAHDDAGTPRGPVSLDLPAGQARHLTVGELETGGDGFDGRLGTGSGKWRLTVAATQPVQVMSLLQTPTGHLTNLSGVPAMTDTVTPPPPSTTPDLVVQSPSVSDSSLNAGQAFTLRATVRNQGEVRSAATTLRWYRSSDATISTTDTRVGTHAVGGLDPSATSPESISLTAPSSAGTYYYGACVDSVSGESDTRNNCSSGVRVTVTVLTPPARCGVGYVLSAGETCRYEGGGNRFTISVSADGSRVCWGGSICAGRGLRINGLVVEKTSSGGYEIVALPSGVMPVVSSPTGTSGESGSSRWRIVSTGDAARRDNRRVLLETARRVANYRQSGNTSGGTGYVLPYFLAERTAGREGFVRIVNRSAQAGAVTLTAIDDEGHTAGTETLNLAANGAIHFRSRDLERGNADKGLSGVGAGAGHWRLVLTSSLDIQPLAYVRTADGFVTRIDAVEAEAEGSANRYVVHFFNPGRNRNQRSYLRLINPGSADARITIDAHDDAGTPRGPVSLSLPAGQARHLTVGELETGGDGFDGRLGTGSGKWRLTVAATQPVQVMSLLQTPTGHLTNLSGVPAMTDVVTPPPPPPPDDHGDTPATATLVQAPSSTTGTLESAGDKDYFRFELSQAGRLQVQTSGSTDTYGTLFRGSSIVDRNDDGGSGTNFQITVAEAQAGTWYVEVRGYDSTATGSYRLQVEFSDAPPPGFNTIELSITDACNDGRDIRYRFFEYTSSTSRRYIGSWPGGTLFYETAGLNQESAHLLACASERWGVCFGAEPESGGGYWGVGIDGEHPDCIGCCVTCRPNASRSWRLTCGLPSNNKSPTSDGSVDEVLKSFPIRR